MSKTNFESGAGVSDANFPLDDEGRVYHLGVKRGEGWDVLCWAF